MSNNEKSYNGYSNYETWCVQLWFDNEPSSAETIDTWIGHARRCAKRAIQTDALVDLRTRTIWELATRVQSEVELDAPEGLPGMYLDLLQHSIAQVNWHELATNMIEAHEENTSYESNTLRME